MIERSSRSGEDHLDRQLAAGGIFLTHDALDFALRGDADLLQELAQRHVEFIFVHQDLQLHCGGSANRLAFLHLTLGALARTSCREIGPEPIYIAMAGDARRPSWA